ncbi:MAG: hypothetical protein HY791_32640 [Deltaproteobacteria bacterium]|nr:hypothetical protein [Deltaproteobacteria bacterium]
MNPFRHSKLLLVLVAFSGCDGTDLVSLPISEGETAILALERSGQIVGEPIVSDGRPTRVTFEDGQRLVVMVHAREAAVTSGRLVSECVAPGPGDPLPAPLRRYISPPFGSGSMTLAQVSAQEMFPELVSTDPACAEPSFCREVRASLSLSRGASRPYALITPVSTERALLVGGSRTGPTYLALLEGEELEELPPDESLATDPEESVFDGRSRVVVELGGSLASNIAVFGPDGALLGIPPIAFSGASRSLSAGRDGSVLAAAHSGLVEVVGSTVAVSLPTPERPEEVAHLERGQVALLGDSRAIHLLARERWTVIMPSDPLAGLRQIAMNESMLVATTAAGPAFVKETGEAWETRPVPFGVRRVLLEGSSIVLLGSGVGLSGLAISRAVGEPWCQPLPLGLTPIHAGLVGRSLWVLLQREPDGSDSDPFVARMALPN